MCVFVLNLDLFNPIKTIWGEDLICKIETGQAYSFSLYLDNKDDSPKLGHKNGLYKIGLNFLLIFIF